MSARRSPPPLPSPVTPAAPADRAATNAVSPKRPRAAPKTNQICTSHGPCRPQRATQPHGHRGQHAHTTPSTSSVFSRM
eukprot:scaffold220963_cov30-Tisochrysis_lutea.AAC.3